MIIVILKKFYGKVFLFIHMGRLSDDHNQWLLNLKKILVRLMKLLKLKFIEVGK